RVCHELERRPGNEAELVEVAQELRVSVRDAGDGDARTRFELEKRSVALRDEPELAVRDRIAVRVVRRVPEVLVDPRLELRREGVLEQLRLRVHLVERKTEPVDEVSFEQAVVPNDLERALPASLRERDAAIREPLDEPELVEALRHRRRRRC